MFLLLNFLVTITVLSIGCYSDLKHRSTSNLLWVVLGVIGFVLNAPLLDFEALYTVFIIVFVCMIVYALKLIGGADIKALISLSLVYPHGLVFLVYIIVLSCVFNLIVFVVKPKLELSNPFLFSLLCGYVLSIAYFVLR